MLRKPILVGLAALGLALGSGAAFAMPTGLQGLAGKAPVIEENGAAVQPVHFKKRRYVVVKRHFAHHCAFPHWHGHFVHCHDHFFVHRRPVFLHPGFHFGHRHFHSRPRAFFSFGFGF